MATVLEVLDILYSKNFKIWKNLSISMLAMKMKTYGV